MDLGKAIRKVRTAKKIRQKELSKRIGISGSSISLIESGHKHPSQKTLKLMSDALGVSVGLLYLLSIDINETLVEGKEIGQIEGIHNIAVSHQFFDLEQAYEEYINLLNDELKEVLTFMNRSWWKSSRIEQGEELRERINKLKIEKDGRQNGD